MADPQDLGHFHRGELPPWNGTGTLGFDYWSAEEAFPAAIPAGEAVTHNASATLSGSGDLSAVATRSAIVAAVLTGAGDLAASAIRTAVVDAVLSGTGALTGEATVESPAAAAPPPPGPVAGIAHELGTAQVVTVTARWDTSWHVEAPVWESVQASGETEWFRAGGTLVTASGDTVYRAHDPDEHELLLYLMAGVE